MNAIRSVFAATLLIALATLLATPSQAGERLRRLGLGKLLVPARCCTSECVPVTETEPSCCTSCSSQPINDCCMVSPTCLNSELSLELCPHSCLEWPSTIVEPSVSIAIDGASSLMPPATQSTSQPVIDAPRTMDVERSPSDTNRSSAESATTGTAGTDKLAQEKAAAEQERIEKAKADQLRLDQEKAAAEKAEQERLAKAQAEQRLVEEKAAAEKAAAEKAALEKQNSEKAAADAKAADEKAALDKSAADRAAEEKAAAEKAEQERLAKAQAEQQRLAEEKAAQEKAAAEKAAMEKQAAEKAAAEKAEQERLAKAQAEQQRLAEEKAAAEKAAQDKIAAEKAAAEKAESAKLAEQKAAEEKLIAQRALAAAGGQLVAVSLDVAKNNKGVYWDAANGLPDIQGSISSGSNSVQLPSNVNSRNVQYDKQLFKVKPGDQVNISLVDADVMVSDKIGSTVHTITEAEILHGEFELKFDSVESFKFKIQH